MSRSTLKPLISAVSEIEEYKANDLPLSGLIKIKQPIQVVKDNKVVTEYRDPTQNWYDELGNYVARENMLKKKVEQGTSFEDYQSQVKNNPGVTPIIKPGNIKMQDYRAKGEAIINRAKQEGRMLSEIEQRKVKRFRHKYEQQYQKNK